MNIWLKIRETLHSAKGDALQGVGLFLHDNMNGYEKITIGTRSTNTTTIDVLGRGGLDDPFKRNKVMAKLRKKKI